MLPQISLTRIGFVWHNPDRHAHERRPMTDLPARRAAAWAALALLAAATNASPPPLVHRLCASLLAAEDAEHGGLAGLPKVPPLVACELLLAGDETQRAFALRTLDAMQDGEIIDPVDGGIYAAARNVAWRQPVGDKPLALQAALVRVAALAGENYRPLAVGAVKYVAARLYEAESGLYRGGTAPGTPAAANGAWIAALALAGRRLDEPGWTEQAAAAGEALWLRLTAPGGAPPELADLAQAADAALELAESTGGPWIERAGLLAADLEARFRSGGGYALTAGGPMAESAAVDGHVASPASTAARVLARLEALGSEHGSRARAAQIVAVYSPLAARRPLECAGLGLAARALEVAEPAPVEPRFIEVPPSDSGDSGQHVGLRIALPEPVEAGGEAVIAVTLQIADGWHLYANDVTDEFLIPTAVEATAPDGCELLGVDYPEHHLLTPEIGNPVEVYEGEVTVRVRVKVGAPGDVSLLVSVQACDDNSCLPPARLAVAVPVAVR